MRHRDQVLALLQKQIGNPDEVKDIRETAEAVVRKWVNPLSGGAEETNGLIYGLVQSGKTGVLTVTGAMGADEGYRTILVLTSDIDPLYAQTLNRVREAFPGIDVLAKADFRDSVAFAARVKRGTCALVTTKNARLLGQLVENFRSSRLRGLSCLIIDDEADQASLNTRAHIDDGTRSAINDRIVELRAFFEKNTYLQVTATPQALFLQTSDHDFRPRFTVLSHPGAAYVGGEDFFGADSQLVSEFPLDDITDLAPGPQPTPTLTIPASLRRALDTFMLGATFKRMRDADQNCAFLCHVSTRTSDHRHIEMLLRQYKNDLTDGVKSRDRATLTRLNDVYKELSGTHRPLSHVAFNDIVDAIGFFSPGITVKLVNGQTDEDVAVVSPYNLFVGGNKLGRGVTIKNLLVSYYGRNPKRPQADTVLQHARMYGYRRKDLGLLRLFLPRELHVVFKAIHKMERSLRELIERRPTEEFRGVFLEAGLKATRRNVLAPGSLGFYSGGSNYNPAQVLRTQDTAKNTTRIDALLTAMANKTSREFSISEMKEIVGLTMPDGAHSERVWDPLAVAESIVQFADIHHHPTGMVYVDRDRDLHSNRAETAGVLTGGEYKAIPSDRLALFMLRTKATKNGLAAWWPQIRFPDGNYAFAFTV